ncbi:enoyl-CoA hydratase-related protein [Domibacillus aminovorans]
MIFTVRRIDVGEAGEIGLVEYVMTAQSLLKKASDIANQIVQNGSITVTQVKFSIDKRVDVDLSNQLAIEQNVYELIIPTKERLEGL